MTDTRPVISPGTEGLPEDTKRASQAPAGRYRVGRERPARPSLNNTLSGALFIVSDRSGRAEAASTRAGCDGPAAASPTPCSIETLHELLRADLDAGFLFWKPRGIEWFQSSKCPARTAARWNGRLAGRRAFAGKDGEGYLHGTLLHRCVLTHRVIWAMGHGEWPDPGQIVDHINGIRDDNRLSNLRLVSPALSRRNVKRHKNNTSGHVGVRKLPKNGKWEAYIGVGKRTRLHLGTFDSFEDAVAAREVAAQQHGYTDRHGSEASLTLAALHPRGGLSFREEAR